MKTPYLTIVTTLDPYPGVMTNFFDAYRQFVNQSFFPVELIVVNGMADTQIMDEMLAVLPENAHLIKSPAPNQGSAILHGLLHADGSVVLSIDPDMYLNIPDIRVLMSRHQCGDQLVYTRRRNRYDASIFRRTASAFFNTLMATITQTGVDDYNSPMFLISREALDRLLPLGLSPDAYKFHAYHLYRTAFSQVDIDVSGIKKKSNYKMTALLRLFFERLVLAFHYRGIHKC